MQESRINSKFSAVEQMKGMFDYNKTHLMPLGIKVIAHEQPFQKKLSRGMESMRGI